MAQASPARHYKDLDGMRGLLASAVMLFHYGVTEIIPRATHGRIANGAWMLCVDFFFILSGFVLYYAFVRSRPTLLGYADKRVRRLAPMFMITTLVIMIARPSTATPLVAAANLLMIQSFLKVPSLNFPGWSIPFELYLPALALPALPWLMQDRRRTHTALLVALLIAGGVLAMECAHDREHSLLRATCGLGSGMLLATMHSHLRPVTPRPALVLTLFGATVLAMLLGRTLTLTVFPFYALSAAAVYFGAQTRTFLSSAPCQALGRWSYSIYLLHIPVLTVVQNFMPANNNVPLKLALIATTFILAALAYRFIEWPIMQWRWRRAPVPGTM